MKKLKHPKDLGIKIGTKEEAFWTNIKKGCEMLIEQAANETTVQTELLKIADKKIAEEKEKLK